MDEDKKVVEQGNDTPVSVQKTDQKKIKKSTVWLVVFAIVAVGGACFGIYSWIANSGRIADLERQVADRDETISKLKQEGSGNEQQPETPAGETSDLAASLLIVSPEQIIDGSNQPVEVELRTSLGGLSITLSKQVGGEMTLFDGSKLNKAPSLSGVISGGYLENDGREEFEITGIDIEKIVDIFISGFGNGIGDETAFFLMADGTVEYMPIMKAHEKGEYKSYGKLPGVENVIKFMSGELYEGGPYGALVGSFAQRADGKLYRLLDVIRETGNY